MALIARSAREKLALETVAHIQDTATVATSGQFVKLVSVGGALRTQPAVLNTDGPSVVGVMLDTDPPTSEPGGPSEPRKTELSVQTEGIFTMKGKSGQTFKPYDPVVIDETIVPTDGQTVRLQGGDVYDNVVGVVAPDTDPAGVAGGNGFNVRVWIAPPRLGRNTGAASILV